MAVVGAALYTNEITSLCYVMLMSCLQVYAQPAVSESSDNLLVVYNCLIDFDGQRTPASSSFPRQFGRWKDGCFLHEPTDAHIRPQLDADGFPSNSGLVYFKVCP